MIFLAAATVATTLSICEFHPDSGKWKGGCGRFYDETPVMTIAPAKSITTGRWADDVSPALVWSGTLSTDTVHDAPLEIEVYRGGWGVLRTIYAWTPLSHFEADAQHVRFAIDQNVEARPSALDQRIVQRAASILSSDAVWNRHDDRNCPEHATAFSIYCAMEAATFEVSGGFSHRRPAMEVVRTIVDERSKGRSYSHRLMDYNNDPSTKLSDVQSLFAEALERMKNQGKAEKRENKAH